MIFADYLKSLKQLESNFSENNRELLWGEEQVLEGKGAPLTVESFRLLVYNPDRLILRYFP